MSASFADLDQAVINNLHAEHLNYVCNWDVLKANMLCVLVFLGKAILKCSLFPVCRVQENAGIDHSIWEQINYRPASRCYLSELHECPCRSHTEIKIWALL